MLANCSLVLLLWWGLNYEWLENVSLLAVKLVIGLIVEVFSQLRLLSTEMILGLGISETIQPGWLVLERNLEDEWSLWWICLECHRAFGR